MLELFAKLIIRRRYVLNKYNIEKELADIRDMNEKIIKEAEERTKNAEEKIFEKMARELKKHIGRTIKIKYCLSKKVIEHTGKLYLISNEDVGIHYKSISFSPMAPNGAIHITCLLEFEVID